MADYWKSQPRKFCQYCKCWIADNKPSVEFHEKGKNHKENVAAKISEIKKKSVQKAKQEQRMSKQFAAMEEAAVKAYEEDLKRMQREEAFGPEAETSSTTSTYKPEPLVQPPKQPQVKTQQPKHKKAGKKNTQPRPPRPQHTEAVVWVEGKTDEGYTYYYNTVTGESRWEKPEEGEGSQSAQHGNNESSTDCAWMEVVSPEGYTYYYNTKTRESSWEKPSDSLSSETPESSQQEQRQEDPSKTAGDPQVTEGEEESKNDQPSMETEVTEQVNQQSTVPQINSRKRKAEADSSEETSKDLDETHKDSSGENRQEKCNVPENNNEEEKQVETQIRKPKAPNPYGSWEKIKEEKDPYANVDWQLPQVEGEATTSADLPPEPKHKFKTRVITSLGDNTGPVTFKKTKTQNGKSRNLRQRDGDD